MRLLRSLVLQRILVAVNAACLTSVFDDFLYNRDALNSPFVQGAFEQVKGLLESNYGASGDAVSIAVVHASNPNPVLTFNHGSQRLNESTSKKVDTDSIFRVVSITKPFVVLSGLALEQQKPSFNFFGTRLRDVLSDFKLPKTDWENGGSDITLDMLASHTAGLPREGYKNGFDLRTGHERASPRHLGKKWASTTRSGSLQHVARQGLILRPGSRPSYSNVGYNFLGYAIADSAGNEDWPDFTTSAILKPLNMSHSFFGPIHEHLQPFVSVPEGDTWVDVVFDEGYGAAGGMWTSVRDLATMTIQVLLRREPELITATQRHQWMTLRQMLPDGMHGVGPGWEIDLLNTFPSVALTSGIATTETVFAKSGDGGGNHAILSVLPALGYAVIILTSKSSTPAQLDPHTLSLEIHRTLAPAFRNAYAGLLSAAFAGTYQSFNGTGFATTQVDPMTGALKLLALTSNNVSALERIDRLGWEPKAKSGDVLFGSPAGVTLHPSNQADGIWRMTVDSDEYGCDWMDWDGYTDQDGVGVDAVELRFNKGIVTMYYDALQTSFERIRPVGMIAQ